MIETGMILFAGFTLGVGVMLVIFIGFETHRLTTRGKRRAERERCEREATESKGNMFWLARGLDPRECGECHLPGDCPLCGAE